MSLYQVMIERTTRVGMVLWVSEVHEFVWSYEWANYKSLQGVMWAKYKSLYWVMSERRRRVFMKFWMSEL